MNYRRQERERGEMDKLEKRFLNKEVIRSHTHTETTIHPHHPPHHNNYMADIHILTATPDS